MQTSVSKRDVKTAHEEDDSVWVMGHDLGLNDQESLKSGWI
jgi:hypothetical protein